MADLPTIRANVALFAAAVTGAGQLETASRILVAALKRQGAELITSIDDALGTSGALLDAGDPIGPAVSLPGALAALDAANDTQGALADLRGLVGRAVFNLNQVS